MLLKSQNRIFPNFKKPTKSQAVYAPTGKAGLKWAYSVKKEEAWVELEIMLPGDKLNSHNVFDHLYCYKSEIEKQFGNKLKWEKINSRKSCRIQTTPKEKYGVDNEDKWDELQETLIDKMERMVLSFTPYIQQL